CPKCGKPLVENFSKKTGRTFVGCSGFRDDPPCKYFKPGEGEAERAEPVETDIKCATGGKNMLRRQKGVGGGEVGGCSGYRECKTRMNIGEDGQPVLAAKPTEYKCEKCGKPMVVREGRRGPFLACTGYPACKNAKDVDQHGRPVETQMSGIDCDKCG